MSGTGKRIRQRREALGLSVPQLAKKVGGLTYQAIQAIEKGGNTRHLIDIAKALGVTPEWLQDGQGRPPEALPKANPTERHGLQTGAKDLPVRGMAECGPDGFNLWNGEIVDWVDRPADLAGTGDAYAVYVVGESMMPRYTPGELVYIHPTKPPSPGGYVLVQIRPPDGETTPRAVIKRYVKRSGDKLVLDQFFPAKTMTIPMGEVVSIHRVVGTREA